MIFGYIKITAHHAHVLNYVPSDNVTINCGDCDIKAYVKARK